MTAHAIKGDRERFLAAGMDDYLAKPFNSHQLYERVERPAGNGHHPTPNAVLEPLAASDGLSAVR
jgi:CheY-like chemotaxis protein